MYCIGQWHVSEYISHICGTTTKLWFSIIAIFMHKERHISLLFFRERDCQAIVRCHNLFFLSLLSTSSCNAFFSKKKQFG